MTITKTEARRTVWRFLALSLTGVGPACEAHGDVAMEAEDGCPDCQRISEMCSVMEKECFTRSCKPDK
jgi:hypothetical protein